MHSPCDCCIFRAELSELKLIKNYFRSSIAYERLSGLVLISINTKVGHLVSYNDVIHDFASRRARTEEERSKTKPFE